MVFMKFENKKIITGIITAIDPIHIGAPDLDGLDPTRADNAVVKDANGNPIIPGSSLKGVIRSNFEAVLRDADKRICDVFDNVCLSDDDVNAILKDEKKTPLEQAEEIYEKSCDVCRLFGGKGIASKLQFKDCSFAGEKCVYEYRSAASIDRETGTSVSKYNFELVPKGTRFNFYMTAENIDDEQDGYLDCIIKMLCSGELSVGAKTTSGSGRIQLSEIKQTEISIDDLRRELVFPDSQEIQELNPAFVKKIR